MHYLCMTAYLDNLLGAVSLAIVDGMDEAAQDALGLGGQVAGALVLIDMSPGITIKLLAERLRLSHPGAVRLVERLVAGGWVRRESGEDRRSVRLTLTDEGAEQLKRLRRARAEKLAALTHTISRAEREILEPLLARLLVTLAPDPVSAYANCRLCDVPVCQARGCPLDDGARSAPTQIPK